MPHNLKKKQSKRLSSRKKFKIQRKVREHNRKMRKESKKKTGGKGKKKEVHVPNSFPFKEQVLREAEERQRRLEEQKQQLKEQRKKQRDKILNQRRSLDGLVADAQKRDREYERKQTGEEEEEQKEFTGGKSVETSLKTYYKEFKKVVDAADVVLQVLDARDPLGSRCPQVEQAVLAAGSDKRLVLILNKIDLVPKENVEQWLKYLRNEFPTIAFKASTQAQHEHLARSNVPVQKVSKELWKSSRCLGADLLMKLLGNYCRNREIKTAIRVGVVGFPNTGKSSIINSLKRSKACNVGAVPGVTKSMQEVQLDKHVKLLDSPGIVMAQGNSDTATVLRNCVKLESLEDALPAASAILKRCNKQQMMLHYNIPDYADVNDFLAILARRMGQLKKKGVPDSNKAARRLLQDWNSGKITYYTHPPEMHRMPTHVSSEIVTKMSREFDIDALLSEEIETLKGLKMASSSDIVLQGEGPTEGMVSAPEMEDASAAGGEDDWEEMDEEEDKEEEPMTVELGNSIKGKKEKGPALKEKKKKILVDALPGNQQLNKARKKDFKKMRKQKKRDDVVASDLASAFEGALGGMGMSSEDYDFGVDFK